MGKSAFEVYSKRKAPSKDKIKTKKIELIKKKTKRHPKKVSLGKATKKVALKKELRDKAQNDVTIKKKKKKIKTTPVKTKNIAFVDKSISPHQVNKIKVNKKEIIRKNADSDNDNANNFDNFHMMPQEALQYLICPIDPDSFFSDYWEKECLHIVRKSDVYYKDLLSSKILDDIIRNNPVYYTKNVDVVSYENDERKTHNPDGRAIPASVWDYYSNGCSVRLLNPHTYNRKIRSLLAMLQEYFGTMAGANVYLTPPGSQGFAPHFDDIEAFVLQIEGRKHWKIYKPSSDFDSLPRYSSKNFSRKELGTPIELTLNAGDLLYFPRGYIHEAYTDEKHHSLHITVSVYQNTAYVDLIEKSLMKSLQVAAASNIEYRRGLPIQYLKHLGASNSNANSTIRDQITSTVKSLVSKLSEYISVDEGADQLGRKFMYDSLPPQLLPSERSRSSKEDGDVLHKGAIVNRGVFEPDTYIRFVRYHSVRLVVEDNVNKLYYSTENANVYHGEEEQYLEIQEDTVDTIRTLLQNYPSYTKIEDLSNKDQVTLMHVISDLWERGLIITEKPLAVYHDN